MCELHLDSDLKELRKDICLSCLKNLCNVLADLNKKVKNKQTNKQDTQMKSLIVPAQIAGD